MMRNNDSLYKTLIRATGLLAVLLVVIVFMSGGLIYLLNFHTPSSAEEVASVKVENEAFNESKNVSLAEQYGFIDDDGVEIVISNCTGCHSSKMVIQNRASRDGWKSMITWMQETQNLWDLGQNEKIILDYLSRNYAPENKGRRVALSNIEWYVLEVEDD